MAAYSKFQKFIEDLFNKQHDLFGTAGAGADTLKLFLTDTTPDLAAHTVKADLTDITNHNGYAGAVSCQNVGTRSGGTLTVTCTNVATIASGGTIGPFRYVVIFNDTPAAKPLVCEFDYGSELTLADGETFTVKFNGGSSSGTLFQAA